MTLGEQEVQDYSSHYYVLRYSGYGKLYHTRIVQWLTEGFTGHILDAGCGNGFVNTVRPDLNIVGIDLSPGMLKLYQGQTAHLMDVCTMPKHWTQVFDGIICRSLLHHLPDHHAGLQEMHRVLKPHGRIALWETNKSAVATWIRKKTQHGDRFSEYHQSFKDMGLLRDIQQWFKIDKVQYSGYLAYPLYGFPDIINFSRYLPCNRLLYPLTLGVDECLSMLPWIKCLSFAIGIQAHKA